MTNNQIKKLNVLFDKHYNSIFEIYNKCNKEKLKELIPLFINQKNIIKWKPSSCDPELSHYHIYELCYISKYGFDPEDEYDEGPDYWSGNGDIFYVIDFYDMMPHYKRNFDEEILNEKLIAKKVGHDIAGVVTKFIM